MVGLLVGSAQLTPVPAKTVSWFVLQDPERDLIYCNVADKMRVVHPNAWFHGEQQFLVLAKESRDIVRTSKQSHHELNVHRGARLEE